MIKLTVKDRRLLYYLSKNSRESSGKLGKLVGISRGAVDYKIQRFKEENIITNFSSVINPVAMGHTSFSMLIKLSKNLQKNDEIFRYFVNHPCSLWAISLSGTYDLFIEFAVKDLEQLVEIIKGIKSTLGESLNYYEVHLVQETIKVEHLISDIYKGLKLEGIPVQKRALKEKELDLTDRKILSVVSKDSSLKLTDIAKKIGSKWDIVRYRMKQMEEAGVIIKYFPEINLKKLGYTEFICKISAHNVNDGVFKSIKNQIKENRNVTYSFVNINSMDIILNCAFERIDGLDSFLSDLQEKFKEYISRIDYYIVRENLKFDLFPDGLVKDTEK